MSGPFETDREAMASPQARAVYAAFDAAPGAGRMAPHNYLMLVSACEAAGVDLGSPKSYDRRILAWLAQWEPQTCVVVAGLIARAHAAARPRVVLFANQEDCLRDMLADAIDARTKGVASDCKDCDKDPAGLCWDHSADLDRVEAYKALAADLGVVMPS